MIFPGMEEKRSAYQVNQRFFEGLNHNLSVGENQFYRTANLSFSHYPVLSPRPPRGRVRAFDGCQGLHDKEGLMWVDNNILYHNGQQVGSLSLGGGITERRFVTMGSRVIIWPDMVMYDTVSGELSPLGASISVEGAEFTLSRVDGVEYGEDIPAQETAPENPANGDYWIDTSQSVHELKVYSSALKTWSSISTTYIKVTHPSLANVFSQYDGISFSGVTNEQFLNAGTDYVVVSTGYGWIVVTGIIDRNFTEEGTVTIARRVPRMDYICESGNRLWGCSSESHEIYACKLGDPTNWYCYQGLSTDSYAATIGSDGDFTGAAAHMGYVLFFKEKRIHKVFGTRPANFQTMEISVPGVKEGCAGTLCLVNTTLYYLSPLGVMRYDGSVPENISYPLGPGKYMGGASGAYEGRYYVSLQDEKGQWGLYLFDEQNGGSWLREDDTHALFMASSGRDMFFVDGDGVLYSQSGAFPQAYADETAASEGAVEWMGETGDFLMDSPDRGYMGRVRMRCEIPLRANILVEAMYDSDGIWRKVEDIRAMPLRSISVEAVPYACDHFRLRLSGKGDVRIYSLERQIELEGQP